MRIAVVTCKVKAPSYDELDPDHGKIVKKANHIGFLGRLPATVSSNDDFVRELAQLMNFHGKSKQVRFFVHTNAKGKNLFKKIAGEALGVVNKKIFSFLDDF